MRDELFEFLGGFHGGGPTTHPSIDYLENRRIQFILWRHKYVYTYNSSMTSQWPYLTWLKSGRNQILLGADFPYELGLDTRQSLPDDANVYVLQNKFFKSVQRNEGRNKNVLRIFWCWICVRRCSSLFGPLLWNRYIVCIFSNYLVLLFICSGWGLVSRMIVLSQFVYSVYVLPVFIVCHCVGLPLWQFIRKRDSYKNIWQELFGKMAITYAWLGFVNIFNFVEFTLSKTSSSGELELTFPLKDMFINYKYSAVILPNNKNSFIWFWESWCYRVVSTLNSIVI